jgi:hypothetical protein
MKLEVDGRLSSYFAMEGLRQLNVGATQEKERYWHLILSLDLRDELILGVVVNATFLELLVELFSNTCTRVNV